MRGQMKRLVFVLAFLALASAVHAQPITKWTARDYIVGGAQPISAPVDLVIGANLVCGVDPATLTPAGANPSRLAWDDPNVTPVGSKACVYSDPGTGPLLSTAFGGNYETTLTATNSAGTSPESARVPFTHPGLAPSVPTGVRPAK